MKRVVNYAAAVIVVLFCSLELCKRLIPSHLIWKAFPGDFDGDGYSDGTELTQRGLLRMFDRYNGHVPRLNLSAYPPGREKFAYSGHRMHINVEVTSDHGWFGGRRPIPVEFRTEDVACLSATPDGLKSKAVRIGFQYVSNSRSVYFTAPDGFTGDIRITATVPGTRSRCDPYTLHISGTPSEFAAVTEMRQLGEDGHAWTIVCDRAVDPSRHYALEWQPGGVWEPVGPLRVVYGTLISERRYAGISQSLADAHLGQRFRVVQIALP
ncbi:MAG TPA: hypothetical protein VF614_00760 [Chthoniobacteraceae bacterium]|jgi:hypothetical protein